jgi:hypothetical protein
MEDNPTKLKANMKIFFTVSSWQLVRRWNRIEQHDIPLPDPDVTPVSVGDTSLHLPDAGIVAFPRRSSSPLR